MDIIADRDIGFMPQGSARQPLLGLTILLVEDSRYCCEAMRLLCRKSGARLRRADTLAAARRHLATYRPSLVIVDIGLPDGSGLDLVESLAAARPRAPVILATSGGEPTGAARAAKRAGADGFLPKPLKNLQVFQKAVTAHFPGRQKFDPGKVVPLRAEIAPDALAMDEDLRHLHGALEAAGEDPARLGYCAQFLRSLCDSCGDPGLGELAARLEAPVKGAERGEARAQVLAALAKRIKAGPVI